MSKSKNPLIIGKAIAVVTEPDGRIILTINYRPYGKKKAKKFNRGWIEGNSLFLYNEK